MGSSWLQGLDIDEALGRELKFQRKNQVPIEIVRRYARRANEAGDSCELVELPGGGHEEHLDPGTEAWRAVTDWLEDR